MEQKNRILYNGKNDDMEEVVHKIMDAIQKAHEDLAQFNIMILGKTGIGKSTLINSMFHGNYAETGHGKPVTSEIKRLEKPGYPLVIYDTPGMELGGENATQKLLQAVKDEIQKGIESGDISKAIHCIWYCVGVPSHRFEETEIAFLKRLTSDTQKNRVPVILVLTQAFSKTEAQQLKSVIEKENLGVIQIVPVLAADYEIDDDYVAKAYGLNVLAKVTHSVIPDAVQKTFAVIQKGDMELKKKRAQAVVAASAGVAAAIGAVPIPFSDAILLIPEQITMMTGITAAFGMSIEKSTMMAIISSTIGSAGAAVLGKAVVAGLLKLIPGAGGIVGGTISAATAASLTAALGEAYIAILTKIALGEIKEEQLSTKNGKKLIGNIFRKRLKVKRNENGEPIA